MTTTPLPVDQGLLALEELLRRPGSAVAVMDPEGFRVAVPASLDVPEEQRIPVPVDRATVLDLVLPGEAMAGIRAWDHFLEHRLAVVGVHLREDPATELNLTFLDLVAHHGVVVGVFWVVGDASAATAGAPVAARARALRPRTAVMRKTMRAMITEVDERAVRMLGWSEEQLVGERSSAFLHPDDVDRAVACWMEMMGTGQRTRQRLRHRCGDGSWLWVEMENEPVTEPDGTPGVLCELNDISEEMAALEEVARKERFFRRLTESIPLGLLRANAHGAVEFGNGRVVEIFGRPTARTLAEQLDGVVASDVQHVAVALAAVLGAGQDSELEVTVRQGGTGSLLRLGLSLIALSDAEGARGAVVCVQDITERARLGAELERRATFDELTGCHNRAAVMKSLDAALCSPSTTGVVFIDLDGFKAVNDVLGHAAGDELLVEVSRRLRDAVRPQDLVGRLGGDEFLVLFTDVDAAEQVLAATARLRSALSGTASLAAGDVAVAASFGHACSVPGDTAKSLTVRADEAMYADKHARKAARA